MAVRLYLIRHAESTWNAEGRVQGQSDPPLSERGRAQAARLADRFRDSGATALYCSPLQRARRTAERIAEAAGLSLQIDDRLKEHNMGLFTGLVWQDIVQKHPEFAQAWLERALDMPGGEKHETFRARAAGVMSEIVTQHPDGKVVVVTHGGILGEYLAYLLGLDPQRRHPFHFDNASISVVDAGGVLPRVHRLNDVSHLVMVAAPGDDARASVDTHEDES